MADAHDLVSDIPNLAASQIGDGPKPSTKRTAILAARASISYLERETGLEPATLCLGSRCSTTELVPACQRI